MSIWGLSSCLYATGAIQSFLHLAGPRTPQRWLTKFDSKLDLDLNNGLHSGCSPSFQILTYQFMPRNGYASLLQITCQASPLLILTNAIDSTAFSALHSPTQTSRTSTNLTCGKVWVTVSICTIEFLLCAASWAASPLGWRVGNPIGSPPFGEL